MVSSKVAGAKNAVTHRLSGLIYMAKDAVHGSVKTTTSLVSTTMSTLMGPRVSRMAKDGMAAALGRSHAFMDHYLLVTDDNISKSTRRRMPTHDVI